jgi:hypothetical protein
MTEIEAEFRADLQKLLNRYGAELEASNHWEGYAECGQDIRMIVDIPAKYDDDHSCLQEYVQIDLGTFVYHD